MQDIFVKNSPFQNTRQQIVEPLARLQSACILLFNNKQRKRARATHTQARTPCHAQIHGILKTSFGLQTFCIPFPTTTCPEKKNIHGQSGVVILSLSNYTSLDSHRGKSSDEQFPDNYRRNHLGGWESPHQCPIRPTTTVQSNINF